MQIHSIKNRFLLFILPVVIITLAGLGIQNYFSTKNTLLTNYSDAKKQVEMTLSNSIELIDAGYRMVESIVEEDLSKKMLIFTKAYQASNGQPQNIDLEKVKKELGGLELYIIDSDSIVRYTTDKNAINFDFKSFGMHDILTNIRTSDKYWHERIMVNVVSGYLGKWIYSSTPDHKYILEFGYSNQGLGEIVKDLDPLLVTKQLKEISPLVKSIRLFGTLGNEFKDKIDENYKPTKETLDKIARVMKEKHFEIKESDGNVSSYLFIDLKSKKAGITDPSKIIEITYDLSIVNKKLNQTFWFSFLFTLFSIILTTSIILILSNKFTRPIQDLEKAAGEIAEGDYTKHVLVQSEDEVGRLANSFNKMVIEIKNSYDKLEQVTKEKAVAETEMNIAREIQTSLLPATPAVSDFELTAFMQTADAVGGDYYDTIKENDREWFLIGDVSGHGVPAGLVMMMVQTAIHTVIFSNPDVEPSKLLEKVNLVISNNISVMKMNKYMTITLFLKDKDGKVYYSGMHQDLVVYRSKTKKVETIETDGNWLGMAKISNDFPVNHFTLNKNDVLFLYTDGITEAVDKDDNQFDLSGLVKFLEVTGDHPVEQIKEKFLEKFKEYKSEDDITFMILKKV